MITVEQEVDCACGCGGYHTVRTEINANGVEDILTHVRQILEYQKFERIIIDPY